MGMPCAALLCIAFAAVSAAERFDRHAGIRPVPLQNVQLQPGSQFDKAVSLNREYLLGLDSNRLLKTFRCVNSCQLLKNSSSSPEAPNSGRLGPRLRSQTERWLGRTW